MYTYDIERDTGGGRERKLSQINTYLLRAILYFLLCSGPVYFLKERQRELVDSL